MMDFKEKPHLLWLGLAVAVLLVESGLFYSIWMANAESNRWAVHTHLVSEKIDTVFEALLDAETGQRGYLLTRRAQYLEPYQKALQTIPGLLDDLRNLTADNRLQQSRLEALRPLIDERLAVLEKAIAVRRAGDPIDYTDLLSTDRGKQVMDHIRLVIQQMKAEELSLWSQRNDKRVVTAGAMLVVMASGAVLLLIVLLLGVRAIERNATARAVAESAEKRHREWLQTVLAGIGDGVMAISPDGFITLMNPVAAQLTGWSLTEARAQPIDVVFKIVNEETGVAVENPALQAIREGRVISLAGHTVLVSQDGKHIPLEDSGSPIVDPAGNLLGAVLVFHDVTEQRRAQAAVRESEAQFRTLANAIPQLCWMANADGWITWYNERWYDYTGTSSEQVKGWDWQSVHDPAVLPVVLERWKNSIAKGEPFGMVFPLRGSDGTFRSFLTRVMPVIDEHGKVARWFGTNTDVSDQLRVEEELRRSEERLRAALQASHTGTWHWDMPTDEFELYENCAKLFDFPSGRQLRSSEEFLSLIHPDDLARVAAGIERSKKKGANLELEFRVIWPNGSVHWLLDRGVAYFDLQGRPEYMTGACMEITDRKREEESFHQAQKLESVGMLAGGIAHDFNNLLVGVIGNASLAQKMLPEGSDAAGLLDAVVKAGEQGAHLTRQLLAYAGKGRFVLELLNLSDLIPEMIGLVQPSISKKIALQMELDGELRPIRADRGQVQQVIMNLVLNAAEAIGSNAGMISVKTRGCDIQEEGSRQNGLGLVSQPGNYILVEVSDTGCGIDEPTKAKIFDPFFSTKFQGRGLGLAAVSGIVRGHNGAISVDSSPGKGSVFTVLFPAAEGSAQVSATQPRDATLRGTGTILVVDDEEMVRGLVKRALEQYGYKVLVAESGITAIDLFKRHPEDIMLVVLDLSMPDMGGEEALPELLKIRPNVKVIVSSGYSESETMRLFAGQHVCGFLQKPFSFARLAEKVKECLS